MQSPHHGCGSLKADLTSNRCGPNIASNAVMKKTLLLVRPLGQTFSESFSPNGSQASSASSQSLAPAHSALPAPGSLRTFHTAAEQKLASMCAVAGTQMFCV